MPSLLLSPLYCNICKTCEGVGCRRNYGVSLAYEMLCLRNGFDSLVGNRYVELYRH